MVLTIPVNTIRSCEWIISSGVTGAMIEPSRSISIRKSPGNCRRPAVSIVCPINRQLFSTSSSTRYSRRESPSCSNSSFRFGSSIGPTNIRYVVPTSVNRIPIFPISKNLSPMFSSFSNKPWIIRLVLVPIKVQVPPRMAR